MSETFKFTYMGVEVTYNEEKDRWEFELRGRNRHSNTPAAAKAAIETPPAKPEVPFERVPALIQRNFHSVPNEPVTVTSVLAGDLEAWIVDAKGDRAKVRYGMLYADTERNKQLVAEMSALTEQLVSLRTLLQEKQQELERLKLPTS